MLRGPDDLRHCASSVDDPERRPDSRLEVGEIVERGTHDELWHKRTYRQLYDKQYRLERDRFINPGEDFTPELPRVVPPFPRGGWVGMCRLRWQGWTDSR